jgi:hypothetical protein
VRAGGCSWFRKLFLIVPDKDRAGTQARPN